MELKIGDKVQIRSDLNENITYGGINVHKDMVERHAGEIATIAALLGKNRYRIREDSSWTWHLSMFDIYKPQETIKPHYTIDKIPGYGTVITLEDGTRIYQSKEGHVVQLSTNSTLS